MNSKTQLSAQSNVIIKFLAVVLCVQMSFNNCQCAHSQEESSLKAFPSEEKSAQQDFRELEAPPSVRVLDSSQLSELLQLTDDQQQRLSQIVRLWKTKYLKLKAEIDPLPLDDHRGRSRWQPTRDRQLQKDIENLLTESQRQLFEDLEFVWNHSPVNYGDGFRFERPGQLNLTPQQQRQLHALQVRWVLAAWAKLEGNPYFPAGDAEGLELSLRESIWGRLRTLLKEAWKFKSERDSAFERILTPKQATRWRQIELWSVLQTEGLRVFLDDYSADRVANLKQADAYRRDWSPLEHELRVPYFASPVSALDLSKEQQKTIARLIDESKLEDVDRPQTRKGWTKLIKRQFERRKQCLAEIENDVMTNSQRKKWRTMLGKPPQGWRVGKLIETDARQSSAEETEKPEVTEKTHESQVN